MDAKEEQHYQSEINMETEQLLSHEEVMVTEEEQHNQSDLTTLIDNVNLTCHALNTMDLNSTNQGMQ